MRVPLGPVAHFTLRVKDLDATAKWWMSNFDLDEYMRRSDRVLLGNDAIVIAFLSGTPDPQAFGHMAFRVRDLAALQSARDALLTNGVALEDPGAEIGPVAPGSTSMGLWFNDLDGYRWELFARIPEEG
jgi:catechol 2,3-dioxygenase-like lactoylglutathione lyase family enzyme